MNVHAKVAAGTAAGAASVVLVWALGQAGLEMPSEVAQSVTVLLTFGVGWLRKG